MRSSMLSIGYDIKSGERDAIRADNVESRDLSDKIEFGVANDGITAEKRMPSISSQLSRDISCSAAHSDLDLILLTIQLQP